MNNFNSYLAILSAMDSAAISRLDWSDEVVKVGNIYRISCNTSLPLLLFGMAHRLGLY